MKLPMKAFAVIVLALCVLSVCAVRVNRPQHTLNKLRARVHTASGTLVASSSITQLQMSADKTTLEAEVAAGTISKSTGVEISWEAASSSTDTIKTIHAKVGGEAGIVSGRTFLYDISGWDGLSNWAQLYATELASYATIDTENSWLYWKLSMADTDEPSDSQCTKFSTSLANNDLASALVVAAKLYKQDLYITDTGLTAMKALESGGCELIAERLDTDCFGYKFFAYFEAPATNPWTD